VRVLAKFTNIGLVKYVTWMMEKNCPYWFSCYGQIATEKLYEDMSKAHKEQYSKWPKSSFMSQLGQKVADCSGEIKSYLMNPSVGDDGIATNPALPSVYNSKYDLSANMLEQRAKEKGAISSIPEIPGLIVWKDGHCGVYVGDGWVIEERGHSYGTVKTKLKDRPWKKWLKHPNIEYIEDPKPNPTPVPSGDISVKLPNLSYDSKNKKATKCDEVTLFQMCANNLGYRDADGKKLVVDGSFGSRSECVCIQFQKDNGILATGIVDQETWSKLLHKRFA